MRARDNLPVTDPQQAAQAAYAAVSAMQTFQPNEIAAGAALLFTEIAKQTGIGVSELVNKAERMAADADTYFKREVKALRDYIKGELR